MKAIILDTRALLIEYAECESLFQFYDNGLKDLVREAVITRSFNSPYTTHHHQGHRYAKGLAAKVSSDYLFACDHHRDLYGEESPGLLYSVESALSLMGTICSIANSIEEDVDKMLYRHLRTRLFEVAQEGSGAPLMPRWIGPDLAVFIRTLDERERRAWIPILDM